MSIKSYLDSIDLYENVGSFEEFMELKYANASGMQYDFFAKEWSGSCFTCSEELFAPNKKSYIKNRLYHTRNECTGGY